MLVGHSGVGKSTLVNALVPGACRAVGVVNDVTGRGRHTSTSAVALRLPGHAASRRGSSTPRASGRSGSRTSSRSTCSRAFADLAEVAEECPRGCTHADDAPDCALDEWVAGLARRRDAGGARPRASSRSAGCWPAAWARGEPEQTGSPRAA